MLSVRVSGGTGAGKKRPLREPAKGWTCSHGHENSGYATRCLTLACNERRST